MITAGIDVGSSTAKAVILQDNCILGYSILPTGADSAGSAQKALDAALGRATSISRNQIRYIIGTGYGRLIIPFADETVTEISCHARGANWLFPSVRTVVDMGGQDCKAIRCDVSGKLVNFTMNDKCAGGTGRFLELMARVLNLPLEQLGPLSLQAKSSIRINSTCAVFGRSEVTALLRQGKDRAAVIAGLHTAVATRVHTLLRRVGVQPDFAITGGIARNAGVVKRLEEMAGVKALIPEEPQIVGALGAALFARDKMLSK
jgi:predicted CoA-substrate-specific enzyme activase